MYSALPIEYRNLLTPDVRKAAICDMKIPAPYVYYQGRIKDHNYSHWLNISVPNEDRIRRYIGTPSFNGWCFHVMWYNILARRDGNKDFISMCNELDTLNPKDREIRILEIKIDITA